MPDEGVKDFARTMVSHGFNRYQNTNNHNGRGEERRGGVIISLQLNTRLLDSAGIEMSPELTAFMASFHVLTTHSLKRGIAAHTQTHLQTHTFTSEDKRQVSETNLSLALPA